LQEKQSERFILEAPLPPEGIAMTQRHKSRKQVADRLSKIEGHVHGIRKMVDEDRGCSDLLLQIAAVRSALDKVAQIILEDHMETCLLEALKSGKADESMAELKEALSKFL
jgi:DNA-binding FrmR family transcriptional regulator